MIPDAILRHVANALLEASWAPIDGTRTRILDEWRHLEALPVRADPHRNEFSQDEILALAGTAVIATLQAIASPPQAAQLADGRARWFATINHMIKEFRK